MAELYDAAMRADPTIAIASTRLLPGLKVPLLPASKDDNQAENQLSIITNAVHEMVSLKQRQALSQAQLSPLQPPDSTQSTLFPENQQTQKSRQQQHNPQQLPIQPSDGYIVFHQASPIVTTTTTASCSLAFFYVFNVKVP